MEQVINNESVRKLSDDELRKLGNRAWYEHNVKLCWLVQTETRRREHEEVEESASI
jgi:hypothetical protein